MVLMPTLWQLGWVCMEIQLHLLVRCPVQSLDMRVFHSRQVLVLPYWQH